MRTLCAGPFPASLDEEGTPRSAQPHVPEVWPGQLASEICFRCDAGNFSIFGLWQYNCVHSGQLTVSCRSSGIFIKSLIIYKSVHKSLLLLNLTTPLTLSFDIFKLKIHRK